MSRRTGAALSVAVALSLALFQPGHAEAANAPVLTADLDGAPLDPRLVGSHFCHDFEFPAIHCYTTAADLEAAMASGEDGAQAQAAAAGAGDYVTIYEFASYAGAYAHLSESYDALFPIGWNDRVSSLRVRNGASGDFYTDWYAGGRVYPFCCNSTISSLGTVYDNAFSSVYRG